MHHNSTDLEHWDAGGASSARQDIRVYQCIGKPIPGRLVSCLLLEENLEAFRYDVNTDGTHYGFVRPQLNLVQVYAKEDTVVYGYGKVWSWDWFRPIPAVPSFSENFDVLGVGVFQNAVRSPDRKNKFDTYNL